MDKIHLIVKSLRIENKMTLKEVASRLGTTEATVQRYESGKGIKSIPYEKIIAYSELFGVSPTYLITGDDGHKPNYSMQNAELANILRKDDRLSDAVLKLTKLSLEDQEQIFGFINLLYKKEKEV